VRDDAHTIQNVVTYDAVIDVDNDEHLLRPGMTASVSIVYAEKHDVVRVPTSALRFRPTPALLAETTPFPQSKRDDERSLWLLRQRRPVPALVRTGVSDGSFSELVDGDAAPGEQAIVELREPGEKRAP
jgi:HlyD family secretion protein